MERDLLSLGDPAKAAVLVVDLQEEQRSGPWPVDGFEAVLANAAALIARARAAGSLVVHGRYVRDFAVFAPGPFEPRTADGGPAFSAAGSAGVEICPEVAPAAGEPVFDKPGASCFSNPCLADRLARQGTDWLLVCGVWTEACVALTVRDAMAQGLRVLLVKDACGSGTDFIHRTGVLNIANRLYGGGVVDSETAGALLGGESRVAWHCPGPVPFRFGAADVDRLYEAL